MLLKSEMVGYRIEQDIGHKVGVLKDFVVDTTEEKWPIVGVVLSPAIHKSNQYLPLTKKFEIDAHEEKMVLDGHYDLEEMKSRPSAKNKYTLDLLDGIPVYSKDDERIGKVYDLAIAVALKPWKVWKLMIDVKGVLKGFKKRRLRLDLRDIEEISRDKMILKLDKDEVIEEEESEEI